MQLSELDSECVAELALYNGYSEEAMEDELCKVEEREGGREEGREGASE